MKIKNLYKNDWFLSLLSGLLFTISWPTYGFPFFIFFAFVPLFLIEERQIKKASKLFFLKIYLAFFIWNLLKTWWIWNATPFGGVFAILVNSLLMTIVFLLFHFVRKRTPERMALAFFIVIWIAFEKFHLNWDFSWPWLNLGNVFSEYPKWIQWYEYTGAFGGAFWVLLVNVLIYKLLSDYIKNSNKAVLYIRILRIGLWLVLPVFFSLYLYNNYQEKGDTATVLILQPNLDPWKEKFKYSNEELAKDLISLADNTSADVIVAPETAISQYTEIKNFVYTKAFKVLKDYALNHHTSFVTGVDFIHWYATVDSIPETANKTKRGKWYDMYNSAVLIDNSQGFEVYHKSKLVVGAEFTPYSRFLKPLIGDFMIDLGTSMGSNVTQPEPSVFVIKNTKIKLAPIICYESVYGMYVTKYVQKGANLLAVITNDGWWGNTEGHRQHFSIARIRAIENRRDLVHSANTGISGYINQRGEIIKKLDYNERGKILAKVRLNNTQTFYTKYGDIIARVAIFMAIVLFLYSFSKKKVRL